MIKTRCVTIKESKQENLLSLMERKEMRKNLNNSLLKKLDVDQTLIIKAFLESLKMKKKFH